MTEENASKFRMETPETQAMVLNTWGKIFSPLPKTAVQLFAHSIEIHPNPGAFKNFGMLLGYKPGKRKERINNIEQAIVLLAKAADGYVNELKAIPNNKKFERKIAIEDKLTLIYTSLWQLCERSSKLETAAMYKQIIDEQNRFD